MSTEPSFPEDAKVGAGAESLNETLRHAVTAKEAEQRSKEAGSGGGRTRSFVKGAAVGVGSAALVAALLYARSSRRSDKS